MSNSVKLIASEPKALYPWSTVEDAQHTIGIVNPCYGTSHVTWGLESKKYKYRKVFKLPTRFLDKKGTFFHFTPVVLNRALPLLHTWNAIPVNGAFIVSFELELPRYLESPPNWQIRRGMHMLASDRCRKILALSDFAFKSAAKRFSDLGFPALERKMSVFRGSISPIFEALGEQDRTVVAFSPDRPLRAIVVGSQLFRKGGMHAIQAFEMLRAMGLNVQLTIVGAFETSPFIYGPHLPSAEEWRQKAQGLTWMRFFNSLPNNEVAQEIAAHDICIYTGFDESLGWLPIEASMLRVPVITTNVCAFPELVLDGLTGWNIPLPLRSDGRWAGLELTGTAQEAALKHADETLVEGIIRIVRSTMEAPATLKTYGDAARAHILELYGIEQASQRLEVIYDEALGYKG